MTNAKLLIIILAAERKNDNLQNQQTYENEKKDSKMNQPSQGNHRNEKTVCN